MIGPSRASPFRAALTLSFLVVGCNPKGVVKLNPITGLEQLTCEFTTDCQAPLLCQQGFCVRACTSSAQCDQGQECNANGLCVARAIIKTATETCASNNECSAGQMCDGTQKKCVAAPPMMGSGDMPPATCGNGTVEAPEACDDGNTAGGDYCSADCKTANGACGDGVKQSHEACDDGNVIDADYCGANCMNVLGRCGDGTKSWNELCDDGNTAAGDYCAADCQLVTGSCGDGIMQTNEACEDGNNADGDYCAGNCASITGSCGDGTRQSVEACDDGNQIEGDYCAANCGNVIGSCGDGVQQWNEACEDGNTMAGDYCSPSCVVSGSCGDGVVQSNEVCDPDAYLAGNPYCHQCQIGNYRGASSGSCGAWNDPASSANNAIGCQHSGDTWGCPANYFLTSVFFQTTTDGSGDVYMRGQYYSVCKEVTAGGAVGPATVVPGTSTTHNDTTHPGEGCGADPTFASHSHACPTGQVAVGMMGNELGVDGGWTTATWLRPICTTPALAKSTPAPSGVVPAGTPTDPTLQYEVVFSCPQGSAISTVYAGLGCFYDGIWFGCSALP